MKCHFYVKGGQSEKDNSKPQGEDEQGEILVLVFVFFIVLIYK